MNNIIIALCEPFALHSIIKIFNEAGEERCVQVFSAPFCIAAEILDILIQEGDKKVKIQGPPHYYNEIRRIIEETYPNKKDIGAM